MMSLQDHWKSCVVAVVSICAVFGSPSALAQGMQAGASYSDRIREWSGPKDVHTWLAENFAYDRARAIELSETQRAKGGRFHILRPEQFYKKPTGICVDIARFAVETTKLIAPNVQARYLRIKFDPVRINGNVLRMHWLASFVRDGKYYFFADSYFPRRMSGPYSSVEEFIAHYQDARGREVKSYVLVDTYRKQMRKRKQKKKRLRHQIRPGDKT